MPTTTTSPPKKLLIKPVPKPRMVKSDTWKKRKCVLAYWSFKDKLQKLAKQQNIILNDQLNLTFEIQMPKSWSKKKQQEMLGKPHQSRPDLDNLVKAVSDCLYQEDSYIWQITTSKIWSNHDSINFY